MKALFLILTMVINLNQHLNARHLDLFQDTNRELLVYGGAGAGKTYSIADKLLVQAALNQGKRKKALLVRKTLAALKKTSLEILERRAETFNLPLTVNRGDWTAKLYGMTFVMSGMNNAEDFQKIKSITDVDFIWINELAEIRENDYKQLLLRLRGARAEDRYDFRQVIGDFNPVGKTSWIYNRFWERNIGAVRKLRYTVYDNPWAEPEYIKQLRETKKDDPNYYKIYFLGEWGELEGVIFTWDVRPLPSADLSWYDEIIYGGDFGYSVDPAAGVRIYRKADEFWLQEILYETGLTNQETAARLKLAGVARSAESYWDSAEPKSIRELNLAGINAMPSEKGADSVRAGIDFLLGLKIHIVEGSENLVREARSYIRKKDAQGNFLPEPIKFRDHLISAARYAIFTHCRNRLSVKIRRLG